MGKLYRTLDYSAKYVEGDLLRGKMFSEADTKFDAMVAAGILAEETIEEQAIIAHAAVATMRVIEATGSEAQQMDAPGTGVLGVTTEAAAADRSVNYVKSGKAAVLTGNKAIAIDKGLVAGPGGVVVEYQAAQVDLMTSVISLATDDFDNSVWGANGKHIHLKASVDDASSQGAVVTCHIINEDDEYEVVTADLDSDDSSIDVDSGITCKKLLAFSSSATFASGSLLIRDPSENVCKSIASVVAATVYGQIVPDDSTNAKGHRVKVTAGVSTTGKLLLIGTDGLGAAQTEILDYTADTDVYSALGWLTVTALLVGDDGAATTTYSICVEANTVLQIIGATIYSALDACKYGVIELKKFDFALDLYDPDLPVSNFASGTIRLNRIDYGAGGIRDLVLTFESTITDGAASPYAKGSMGMSTSNGLAFVTDNGFLWQQVTV